ncbi:MAG: hypothetical protein QOK02_3826, partial [Mycobacterium sp.]|nr:hypothetical protein [Mycobacterium sp.]
RWRSQELNAKLLTIAERVVAELPDVLATGLTATTPVDHYLMSLAFEDPPPNQ